MKLTKQVKMMRNYVAKYAKTAGAGQHKVKRGPRASRARQKQNFLKGVE
jgi:hypothetical protein